MLDTTVLKCYDKRITLAIKNKNVSYGHKDEN